MKQPTLFSAPPSYLGSQLSKEQDALGEIRALLLLPPSAKVWQAIWSCLQGVAEEPLVDTYVPYVIDHLAHWPDGLRPVPNKLKPLFFSPTLAHHTKAQKPRYRALLSLTDTLEMSFSQTFNAAELQHLATNPLSRSLTTLHIYQNTFSQKSWQAFTESKHLSKLRHLSLHSFQFSDKQLQALGAALWSHQLRSLQFTNCNVLDIPDATMTLHMPQLTHLTLFDSQIDALIAMWMNAPTHPPMTHIHLKGDVPSPEVLQPLLQTIASRSLQSLRAESYGLDARVLLSSLCASGPYPHLSTLRLDGLRDTAELLQELLCSDLCPALQALELSQLALGAGLVHLLEASPFPGQLRSLCIQFDDLGEQGLTRLTRLPQLASLEHLAIRGIVPTAKGLEALFLEPSFVGLKTLDLRSNKIGQRRGMCMGQEHGLQALEALHVSQNPLGDELVLRILMNPSTPHLHTFSCQQCSMGLPGLYAFLTMPEIPQTLREKALLDLLEQCDREGLGEIMETFGINKKGIVRKGQMIQALRAHITTPEALEEFLCHNAYTKQLNLSAIKATLRTLGIKNYAKLRLQRLRTLMQTSISASQGVLVEASAKILKGR